MIAEIAVSAAVFAIDKPYSYAIPEKMTLAAGQRVMVPFGKGNRRAEGIVLAVKQGGQEKNLKPVDRVLDDAPILTETMLRTAAFVRSRYFCTFYDAARAMLPAGFWFTVRDTYTLAPAGEDYHIKAKRNPVAISVMDTVTALGGSADYTALRRVFPDEDALQDALRYLLRKKLLCSDTDMLRRAGDKTEYLVTLTAAAEDTLAYAASKQKSAPLQHDVLALLCSIGSGSAKEILYFTGASMVTLRRLEKLGYLELSTRVVERRPTVRAVPSAEEVTLTQAQQTCCDGLCRAADSDKPGAALLYGVTGSGKTPVYLKLISHVLAQGKSAMLLVPEIALTPQLMERMVAHFGEKVAILHSGLRVGERYDEWKRIKSGKATVVVGTRSAVFAPAQNLGVIILDEEQEHTYKSENTPRYHAREVALYRGLHEGALVALGSATPSVETMYHARRGDYALYTLSERYNGRELPATELCDMRSELRSGSSSALSRRLLSRLRENAAAGKQAILFLNRRGSSRFLVCAECGDVPKCPRCSVSLTYHSANGRLMCHYCGYSEPAPMVCPQCGGHLKYVGAGTQRVEQELKDALPDAKILRMDADTVSAANSHEMILSRFRDEMIPILLGTQMVAKGLDFPDVTLVGVLDADLSLYVDHFRAAETTFSMITQVIGRAGRGSADGLAMIQTMTPEHKVITLAAQQDYDAFYDMEIKIRELRGFPPFSELFLIGFSGQTEDRVLAAAATFRRWLEENLKSDAYKACEATVLGPAPAPVAKINLTYHYRLTVLSKCSGNIQMLISFLLRAFAKDKNHRGVSAFADRNPYE